MTTPELTDSPSPDDIAMVSDSLFAHNNRAVGSSDFRPLAVLLRDDRLGLIGGLVGWTRWGKWAHIDNLWIHEEHRRRGHGTRLLAMAEAEAVRRGCSLVDLDTFDFQAPGFYLAHGYERLFALEIHGQELIKIFLRKNLA